VPERAEPLRRGGPAGHGANGDPPPWNDRADETHEPGTVAEWAEFQAKVEALPEAERAGSSLHRYEGLSFPEIGQTRTSSSASG
jgi:DNA-directed RNA polymerase specialized sigma24 family protein